MWSSVCSILHSFAAVFDGLASFSPRVYPHCLDSPTPRARRERKRSVKSDHRACSVGQSSSTIRTSMPSGIRCWAGTLYTNTPEFPSRLNVHQLYVNYETLVLLRRLHRANRMARTDRHLPLNAPRICSGITLTHPLRFLPLNKSRNSGTGMSSKGRFLGILSCYPLVGRGSTPRKLRLHW